MKRFFVVMLILASLYSFQSFAQEDYKSQPIRNLYITSFFDVDVYRHNRKIGVLRNGVRAQVLRGTKRWLLVQYTSRGKTIMGWIRR